MLLSFLFATDKNYAWARSRDIFFAKMLGLLLCGKLEMINLPYTILLCPGIVSAKSGVCAAIH